MENKKIERRPIKHLIEASARKSLIFHNLHPDATPGLLVELTKQFGAVHNPRIIPNKKDPKGMVYGFVDMKPIDADKAMAYFRKMQIKFNEHVVSVNFAHDKYDKMCDN